MLNDNLFGFQLTAMTQIWKYALGILIALVVILGFGKPVRQTDMLPSLPKWSWIWWNSRPLAMGQLVLMQDPLNPKKQILRRILALPTDSIEFRNDNFRVTNNKITQVDMHIWDNESRVFKESIYPQNKAISWGIIQNNATSHWEMPTMTIPAQHVFVACDNRFNCLDSRWWGPVSIDLIEGQVHTAIAVPWNVEISFFQQFE